MMKIEFGRVARAVRLLVFFLLACLLVNFIMVHLPEFIRSLCKALK